MSTVTAGGRCLKMICAVWNLESEPKSCFTQSKKQLKNCRAVTTASWIWKVCVSIRAVALPRKKRRLRRDKTDGSDLTSQRGPSQMSIPAIDEGRKVSGRKASGMPKTSTWCQVTIRLRLPCIRRCTEKSTFRLQNFIPSTNHRRLTWYGKKERKWEAEEVVLLRTDLQMAVESPWKLRRSSWNRTKAMSAVGSVKQCYAAPLKSQAFLHFSQVRMALPRYTPALSRTWSQSTSKRKRRKRVESSWRPWSMIWCQAENCCSV